MVRHLYGVNKQNVNMASDDVGLKLCEQHLIKLDFEIKAAVQVVVLECLLYVTYVVWRRSC